MAECQIIQEVCKRAGERKAFPAFELERRFARIWLPNHPFANGVIVRPASARQLGLEYVSSGGQSGGREPKRWPGVVGQTLVDRGITWTAQALSYAGLIYRIDSVAYDVPAGVALHEQPPIDEPGAQQVSMEVSGGNVGEVYDVVAELQATAVGQSAPIYELVLRMAVE